MWLALLLPPFLKFSPTASSQQYKIQKRGILFSEAILIHPKTPEQYLAHSPQYFLNEVRCGLNHVNHQTLILLCLGSA